MEGLAKKVRRELVRPTLEHAKSISRYYKRVLEQLDLDGGDPLVTLRSIPLLSKRDLTDHYEEICRPETFPALIMYTSGTGGKQLLVPVSADEIRLSELLLSLYPAVTQGKKPLTLSIGRVGHGGQLFNSRCPTIPAHIAYGPDQVMELLCRKYNFPGVDERISILEGNLLTLRTLTKELLKQNRTCESLSVRVVMTTGWYVTPFMRNLLSSFWGAKSSATVLDRYGVTELNGDAKQCPHCSKFHFDPFVIAEVVHPLTKQPVEDGYGSVVLTGLWPFNQVAPKIRYEIGDLVRVTKDSKCPANDPSYDFLGRLNQTIVLIEDRDIRYVLFPTEIADVLDGERGTVYRLNTGFINFNTELIQNNRQRPLVRANIEWQGQSNARAGLEDRILSRSSFLQSAVQDKLVNFEVVLHSPHSLSAIHKT